MRRTTTLLVIVTVLFLAAGVARAVYYVWQDPDGKRHMADTVDKIPQQYRGIIDPQKDRVDLPDGRGYYLDDMGTYHFYTGNPKIPATPVPAAAPVVPGPGPVPVNPSWKGTADPVVVKTKVEKVLTPDTVMLEGGVKFRYVGIAFPPELNGNQKIYNEALEYHRRLVQGKNVAIMYDKVHNDDQGYMLGFMFYGTDIFINADLVMNGYDMVKPSPPNLDYQKLFIRLQTFARTSQLGIWQYIKGEPAAAPSAAAPGQPKEMPLYIPEGYDKPSGEQKATDSGSQPAPKEVPLYIPPGQKKEP